MTSLCQVDIELGSALVDGRLPFGVRSWVGNDSLSRSFLTPTRIIMPLVIWKLSGNMLHVNQMPPLSIQLGYGFPLALPGSFARRTR